MRLQLINPSNSLVSMVRVKENRWNCYRVWKPLGLMALAGLTPPEWEIAIVDENLGVPDYAAMPRPGLVGITAFTSQANRAYQVAAHFRHLGVPVVMGGIHATPVQTKSWSMRIPWSVHPSAHQTCNQGAVLAGALGPATAVGGTSGG